MTFPDPFPALEHETAEVNGIKCSLDTAADMATRGHAAYLRQSLSLGP